MIERKKPAVTLLVGLQGIRINPARGPHSVDPNPGRLCAESRFALAIAPSLEEVIGIAGCRESQLLELGSSDSQRSLQNVVDSFMMSRMRLEVRGFFRMRNGS